jgi:hypothetical protein
MGEKLWAAEVPLPIILKEYAIAYLRHLAGDSVLDPTRIRGAETSPLNLKVPPAMAGPFVQS